MKSKDILTTFIAASAVVLTSCGKKEEAATPAANSPSAPAVAQAQATPAPVATSHGTPGGVPLAIEFPPELIEGTPKPMDVPGLVQAPMSEPTFLVPEGSVLLSAGKTVTASDDAPIIGDLTVLTDGDKDAGEGYFVELLEGVQWAQIDLEQSAEIHAIWVWHFHSQKRAYNDVIVQISDDPEFKTGVTTVFNNDYDDSAKMGKGTDAPYVESRFGKAIDGKGTKGRYVRLYSNGSTGSELNHYIEVEVYGKAG
jgi:hypothetical protein